MRIGVISDTHGAYTGWDKAFQNIFNDVDIVIHLGDITNLGPKNPIPEGFLPRELTERIWKQSKPPVIYVQGNCDAEVDKALLKQLILPSFLLQDGNRKIFAIHGHVFGNTNEEIVPKYVEEVGKKYGINILLFGHTHRIFLDKLEGIVVLNPGSASIPLSDVEKFRSVAKITENKITIYNLDTLEIYKEIEL